MYLLDLIDDILYIVQSYLDVSDILALRSTCKHLHDISYSRTIWQNACNRHVVFRNLPFPHSGNSESLQHLDARELEQSTRHALRLHRNWTSKRPEPVSVRSFKASASNIVSDVRLIPRRGHQWLVTVSKGIWSVISCWDYSEMRVAGPRKVGEWSRKGALIKNVAVNSDPESEGCIVVAYMQNSTNVVEVNAINTLPSTESSSPKVAFTPLFSLQTNLRPVALMGDIIVLSDDFAETRILEWKTGRVALLRATDEAQEDVQHDKCLAVLFAHESVFVARARSLDLFPLPQLVQAEGGELAACYPIASYSFGWIDSIAISFAPPEYASDETKEVSYPAISILLRAESDNPWSSNIHRLRRYILSPNPLYLGQNPNPFTPPSTPPPKRDIAEYLNPETGFYYDPECPYLFPPFPTAHIPALRGFLRCPDVAMGPLGSALWVQPRPRTARVGLTMIDPAVVEQLEHNNEMPATIVTPNRQGVGGVLSEVPQHHSVRAQAAGARALMVNFREECLCAAMFPGPFSRVGVSTEETDSNSSTVGGSSGSGGATPANSVDYGEDHAEDQAVGHHAEGPENDDEGEYEALAASSVPSQYTRGRRLWVNTHTGVSWTSMDYDEGTGRIALGASDGSVTMLFM